MSAFFKPAAKVVGDCNASTLVGSDWAGNSAAESAASYVHKGDTCLIVMHTGEMYNGENKFSDTWNASAERISKLPAKLFIVDAGQNARFGDDFVDRLYDNFENDPSGENIELIRTRMDQIRQMMTTNAFPCTIVFSGKTMSVVPRRKHETNSDVFIKAITDAINSTDVIAV